MDARASFIDRPFGAPVALSLPIPPSVNSAYRNVAGRGRAKTAAYTAWLKSADMRWLMQKRTTGRLKGCGRYGALIEIPAGTRGDVDGRIKLILDYLVSREITDHDRHCWEVTCRRSDALADECRVIVRAM